LNDLSSADVQTVLENNDLDHLIQVAAGVEKPTIDSYLDQIMNKDGSQTHDPTTDSQEAQVDGGGGGTDWTSGEKNQIRDALGIDGTKTAAASGDIQSIETKIDGVKTKTDNLPVNTATELDNIDSALVTVQADLDSPAQYKATGFSTHTPAQVWSETGRELSTPNNYKADVSGLATTAALSTHDGKLDTVDTVVDGIKTKTDNLPANTSTILNRILGITDENCYIDLYSITSGKMSSCRKRIYDSKANAEAHGATGLLATYTVTVTWSGDNIQSYMMVLD